MTTQFILARHGETEWNRIKRLQGHLDSPISLTGYQQVNTLGESLTNECIDRIITSPLGRALSSAKICQEHLNCTLTVDERLIERDFGLWQARLFESLTNEPYFYESFYQVTEHKPPQGESGVACANRINQALKSIAEKYPSETILVITHGDAIRCFLSLCTQQQNSQNELDAYSQHGNAGTFRIQYDHVLKVFQRQTY